MFRSKRTQAASRRLVWTGLLASILLLERAAFAQSGPQRRISVDAAYEIWLARQLKFIDAYAHDPASGCTTSASVMIDRVAVLHGFVAGASYEFLPWFSLGVEGSMHQDLSAPAPEPYLERLGLQVGARRIWGIGVACEFRPWQATFQPRRGLFLRGSFRTLWIDYGFRRDAHVVEPDGSTVDGGSLVHSVGYRVPLDYGTSFSLQGIFSLSSEGTVGGLGLGGGFQ